MRTKTRFATTASGTAVAAVAAAAFLVGGAAYAAQIQTFGDRLIAFVPAL